jgi:nucleotide-binding universal stress UspA family protein
MLNRIVVPVAPDEIEPVALGVALAFADRLNAPIELVTVSPERDAAKARDHLASLADNMSGATSHVIVGEDVESELVGEAIHDPDSLLVVSSVARRAITESMWGSVSEQLARDAGVPLLLVGPHATDRLSGDPPEPILLIPLDGSPESEAIIGPALNLARALRLQARLVQVVDPDAVPDSVRSVESSYLHNVAKTWHDVDPRIEYDVLHGRRPSKAISDYVAVQDHIVLVAMATRGLPVAGRLIHPSTTFSLLRQSLVPVVVLHRLSAEVEHFTDRFTRQGDDSNA